MSLLERSVYGGEKCEKTVFCCVYTARALLRYLHFSGVIRKQLGLKLRNTETGFIMTANIIQVAKNRIYLTWDIFLTYLLGSKEENQRGQEEEGGEECIRFKRLLHLTFNSCKTDTEIKIKI